MIEIEQKQEQAEAQAQEKQRGARGVVGVATAAKTIKKRWHQQEGKKVSLKAFARKLADEGDQVAKDWLAHKSGSLNQKRSEKNVARVALEKSATKLAKKSKGK